jgi:octaprenyl-diphosphate synthase
LDIAKIIKPYQNDVDIFTEKYKEIMQSNIPLVDVIAKYLVKTKGKQFRPLLVVMTARLCGNPTEATYISAAIIELLHVASLVHDDVVDNADSRRGFSSIKAKWTNKVAVLMGDYLLSKSLLGAIKTDGLEIMKTIANAAKRLTKGELFQLEKSRKHDITEDEYYQLISDKTAALFTASTTLGALTSDERYKENLIEFGENLGIAFQIKDDLLDYQSKISILGKPAHNDLLESKQTLPLIYALKTANSGESKEILKELKKSKKKRNIKKIVTFVKNHGGIEYSEQKSREYTEKAKSALSIFSDSEYKTALLNVVDYAIERKK